MILNRTKVQAKKSAQFIAALSHNIDKIQYSAKSGEYVAKESFFYKHGNTAEKFAAYIQSIFPAATIHSAIEGWKAWPKTSYFVVRFSIEVEAVVAQAERILEVKGWSGSDMVEIIEDWKQAHS